MKRYFRGYSINTENVIWQIESDTYREFYANEFRKIYALIGFVELHKSMPLDRIVRELEEIGHNPSSSLQLRMEYVNKGVRYVRDRLFSAPNENRVHKKISGILLRKLAYKGKGLCCAIPVDADTIAHIILHHVFYVYDDPAIQNAFKRILFNDCLNYCEQNKYIPDTEHVCRRAIFTFHIEMLMKKAIRSQSAANLLHNMLQIPEMLQIVHSINAQR